MQLVAQLHERNIWRRVAVGVVGWLQPRLLVNLEVEDIGNIDLVGVQRIDLTEVHLAISQENGGVIGNIAPAIFNDAAWKRATAAEEPVPTANYYDDEDNQDDKLTERLVHREISYSVQLS